MTRSMNLKTSWKTMKVSVLYNGQNCPKIINLPNGINQLHTGGTKDNVKDWWYNETYEAGDVLYGIRKPGLWYQTDETIISTAGYYDSLNVSIKTVHTAYGRCFSVYFDDFMVSNVDYYTLNFSLAEISEMTLYVHEKHNEVGLLWSFWPIDPIAFNIKKKQQMQLIIQKNTFIPRISQTESACNNEESYSYPKCVTDWLRKKYLNLFAEHSKTG